MAECTGIAWCDATVNFWWGCTRVSPGCVNCYAEQLAATKPVGRPARLAGWGPRGERVPIVGAVPLAQQLQRRAIRERQRLRVFTNSMSDFFDERAPAALRATAWAIIRGCPALDWLVLTKRPENFAAMLPEDWGVGWKHVWLGVSCEDQQRADERIPVLLDTPAAVRFISAEPLLGPLDLAQFWLDVQPAYTLNGLDWVIVGGESGAHRRPMEMDWLVSIVAQCQHAGVPVFVKQDTAYRPDQQGRIPDASFIREWPVPPGDAA